MKSSVSVLGLYEWDSALFSKLMLPDGVDREVAVDTILAECAELEVLYPNWNTMRDLIGIWSRKELPVWSKLYATTAYKYDAIHNYDRTEEWSESGTRRMDGSTTTSSASNAATYGFNSSAAVPTDEATNTGTATTADTETDNSTKKGRAYGNIGVTTTQELIKQEREISEFNIYDHILQGFKSRFCLQVY